jgi:DNA-binding transcriptional LysR family regulator
MDNPAVFDWNDLRYFLAVARGGSTLAAARMLGASQSTVHRRLAELEKHIGCKLAKRSPTGYQLTNLGRRLLEHAERAEEVIATFERHEAGLKHSSRSCRSARGNAPRLRVRVGRI